MSERSGRRLHFVAAFVSFLLSLGVYLRTMLPGVGGYGDTSKFQFVGKTLGLPHPSGFPTYLFINALFARLPWGTLAWRINFMSAIFGALTVAVLCLVLARLTKDAIAAAASSLLFAFTLTFWSTCLIAEVYTLAFFFLAATIYCLLVWEETKRRGWFYLACALYAVSFGNHLMVIVLIPSFVFLLFATDRSILRSGREIAAIALIVALAACQYLFIYFRSLQGPAYSEGAVRSLGELVWFATGGTFRRHYFEFSPREVATLSFPTYLRLLLNQFGAAGIALAAAGFVVFFIRRRRWATFFLLLYVTTVLLYVNGPHVEQPIYFVPATMALAVALCFVCGLVRRSRPWRAAAAVVLLLLAAYLLRANFAVEDLSGKREYGEVADSVLAKVKNDSIILSPNYHWTEIFLYKMLGEKKREGDGVRVLHHWSSADIGDYARGRVGSWDPYSPPGTLPDHVTLYLFALERDPPALRAVRAAGWRAVPVIAREHPLFLRLRSLGAETLVLAAVKDEGSTILSEEGYDVVNALGFRTRAVGGNTFGWAAADAVVRYEGRWRGWKRFRYSPVEIAVEAGERIVRTPFAYPAAARIVCAGYGRGDVNEIFLEGRRITDRMHGLNVALVGMGGGGLKEVINVPPAELGRLRPFFLYELVPPGEG